MKIVNTYCPCLPVIGHSGKLVARPETTVMAVLTQDEAGLYAAYVALVPFHERGIAEEDRQALLGMNAEAVARLGSKLSYAELGTYFRGIERDQYRR